MPVRNRSILAFVALFLLVAPTASALADADTGLPSEMDHALTVLGLRRPAAKKARLREIRRGLLTVSRDHLDDDTWVDLHLLLIEIDRRLTPKPPAAPKSSAPLLPARPIPRTLTDGERTDPMALLDLAASLAVPGPGTYAAISIGDPRAAIAAGAKNARELSRAAQAIDGDDPLLRAAAAALVEVATDLAFDLDLRADGLAPEGREGFAWLLEKRHRLSFSPEEALSLGRDAVADCLALLREEARRQSPDRSWQVLVLSGMSSHPAGEEELLAYCREVTAAAERLMIESGLITIFEFAAQPRVILGEPSFPAPYASYLPGGKPNGGRYGGRVMYTRFEKTARPGTLPALLRDRSRAWLKVIGPHEANPGHHLQFATADRIERPCRGYGYSSTYVEGWGLYTEELMSRAGFYETRAERLAFLRMKLWRAVRVVVDAGLHVGDLRPSTAVRMLTGIVLLERSAAEAEVRRYMTMPTQPLSYLIGYRKIRAIRDAYVAMNGSAAEREFHDRFLALGPVPLDLAAAVLLGKRRAYDLAHRE